MMHSEGERYFVVQVQRAMLVGCALLTSAGCAKRTPPAEQAVAMAVVEKSTQAIAPTEAMPELTLASASTTPAADRALPARPISFDTIQFNITVGQPFERAMLTPAIEKLLGRRIRIRGWIQPFTMF